MLKNFRKLLTKYHMKWGPGSLGVSHWTLLQRVMSSKHKSDLCSDFSAHRLKHLSKMKLLECEKCQAPIVVQSTLRCRTPLPIITLIITDSTLQVLIPQKWVLYQCLGGQGHLGIDYIQR
jgi:hypothetical protein